MFGVFRGQSDCIVPAYLRGQQLSLPPSVGIQDLINQGLLKRTAVAGFTANGEDVSVSLTADFTNPQDTLLRIRLQDGSQCIALVDGSVKEVSR